MSGAYTRVNVIRTIVATVTAVVALSAATVTPSAATGDLAKQAKAGTATITIDGTTWSATADKGGCVVGPKGAYGAKYRSFTGSADGVKIVLTVDPANPTVRNNASVKGSGGDPYWEARGARVQGVKVKGRTASGTGNFISPIKDAEAVAARQVPTTYPGTFSFTC